MSAWIGRLRGRTTTIALVVAFIVAGCSITTTNEQVQELPNFVAPTEVPEPIAPRGPTVVPPTAVPPAVSPPSTATPSPVPSPPSNPTPTSPPVDDGTPVVIESDDGWVITQGEIDEMVVFIEETHQLLFTAPVDVLVSRDIGVEFAAGFEIFSVDDWFLMQALGLVDSQADRDDANQLRRDRIRGVCCQFNGNTSVAVEVQPTKLATEIIVVHELTHALHTQHDELFRNTSFDTTESPAPFAAAIEGVPQFVTFQYLALAPIEERMLVTPDLPIIRDDMLDRIDAGPARHLNFAYATGPRFVEAVVEARGLEGLSDLISSPPTTTEQVLFPEKYLEGEGAETAPVPSAPENSRPLSEGTIGAAMFMFLLTDDHGEATARQLVEPWTADTYVVYEGGGQTCLVANIMMDDPGIQVAFAGLLRDSLRPTFPQVATQVSDEMIELTTCP